MIRSVCAVCGYVYSLNDDGRPEVMDSHGYCQKHFCEAMTEINTQFPDYPADVPAGRCA